MILPKDVKFAYSFGFLDAFPNDNIEFLTFLNLLSRDIAAEKLTQLEIIDQLKKLQELFGKC